MTPDRLATIKKALDRRQTDLTVVMENVCKPHNLAAVARTLEAVGGLDIHAITKLTSIRLTQMSAGGVKKWITVNKHPDTQSGLDLLRNQGMQIIATCISEDTRDYRDIDYTRPTAILVGEELEGLSDQAREMADHSVSIPMAGMVQSLNVSIAASLILYEAFHQRMSAGMYDRRSLDDARYKALLFEACHPRVAYICQQKKAAYPEIDDDGMIITDTMADDLSEAQLHCEESFAE